MQLRCPKISGLNCITNPEVPMYCPILDLHNWSPLGLSKSIAQLGWKLWKKENRKTLQRFRPISQNGKLGSLQTNVPPHSRPGSTQLPTWVDSTPDLGQLDSRPKIEFITRALFSQLTSQISSAIFADMSWTPDREAGVVASVFRRLHSHQDSNLMSSSPASPEMDAGSKIEARRNLLDRYINVSLKSAFSSWCHNSNAINFYCQ